MSYFTDWRIHYDAGRFRGWLWRGQKDVRERILKLDKKAMKRELAQKKKSNTPNDPLSAHQLKEAMAWGAGARAAAGITDLPYPTPLYPEGATWT